MNKAKISELITILSGGTPKTNEQIYWNGKIKWLSVADFKNANKFVYSSEKTITEKGLEESSTQMLQKNDIIISARGTVGKLAILKEPMAFNQSCFGLRAKPKILDQDFLFYCLKNEINNIAKRGQGSVFNTIVLDTFNLIDIQYPNIQEQQKISQALSALDNKIETNLAIISKLEEMAKMIYEYWFLQFDFPNHEGKPYASSGGAMKYSEELGREIPTDWEVENFYQNSLFSLVPTGVEKFSSKCYLATADIVGTSIGEGKQVEYETRETRANMQPKINSVWFAKMKNSIKHLFLNEEMGFLIENYILSTGFFGLQCSKTSFEYIASTISHPSFEIKKDSLAHGATQEAVNQNDLQSIKLLVPNILVLEKFHKLTKPMYGYISQMRHENQKLAQLRDWLLPMLMNGQVRVE